MIAPMATWTAFLRAINLGARRKFPKAAIKEAVESCGFTGVETYINTGNVRFEAALEQAFLEAAGFEVPTIVLRPAELRAIADDAAALRADLGHEGRQYVSLLKREPTPEDTARLEALSTDREVVRVRGRGVHLLLPPDDSQPVRLSNATVEKLFGVATNRNLNVVRTLADKWGA